MPGMMPKPKPMAKPMPKPMKPVGKPKPPPFVDPRIAANAYSSEMAAKDRLAGKKPAPAPPPKKGPMMNQPKPGRSSVEDAIRFMAPGDKVASAKNIKMSGYGDKPKGKKK